MNQKANLKKGLKLVALCLTLRCKLYKYISAFIAGIQGLGLLTALNQVNGDSQKSAA